MSPIDRQVEEWNKHQREGDSIEYHDPSGCIMSGTITGRAFASNGIGYVYIRSEGLRGEFPAKLETVKPVGSLVG